jgi:hypothetical protein
MAQPAKKPPENEFQPPVPGHAGGPPAALVGAMQADAGKGVSTAQEDNLVPLIYVLQTNSPQVNKRDERYVEGAEPGDIWLRNATHPVIKGEEGFLFQPCHFTKDWVEWVPRDNGGGFVGRHDAAPADVKEVKDPANPNRVKYKYFRPNGNEVKETRNHMGYAVTADGALAYAIPLTSSGHTVSREWMGLMNRQRIPGSGEKPASWAVYYKLRTKQRHNKDGDWFVLVAENAGGGGEPMWVPSLADYERGKALHEAFASGAKKAEAPAENEGEGTNESTDVPF